ncbi:MAG TPA: purine nucleoside phosphorylase DeoD-type [Porphyromonadaceae bacterium]|nr:purine nucleoside phosphorylase DeoD-type [Porphyromonadaceae bacterium]
MATAHNNANVGDIAKSVIMLGDPKRVRYLVEKFLTDSKLVSDVRGIPCFTGMYNGKKLSVMASGMGIPSMGIYSYELFKFYDVERIIRAGTCGAMSPDLKLFDVILSENVFSGSTYAFAMSGEESHIMSSSKELNDSVKASAKKLGTGLVAGNSICNEAFDPYAKDNSKFMATIPDGFNPVTSEMEAFSLFYNAKLLGKEATCLMTVTDSPFIERAATAEERQLGLDTMLKLALESI